MSSKHVLGDIEIVGNRLRNYSMIELSVIIPTKDRAAFLRDTLFSLIDATNGVASKVECIVVDNGSVDNTSEIVRSFSNSAPFSVCYVFEPCPGLHVGRNLGAQVSRAPILAYLDDDVIVKPGWASAILNRFASSPDIVLLGGPCIPLWEAESLPLWLWRFRSDIGTGWMMSTLSLIDLNIAASEVSGCHIFGCNYAIRKDVLFELGGFHPDGLPELLLQYRGDGETSVAIKVNSHFRYCAYYDNMVCIYHRVPQSRITKKYFLSIAKRNAISEAYLLYRQGSGFFYCLTKCVSLALQIARNFISTGIYSNKLDSDLTTSEFDRIFVCVRFLHFVRICLSPKLALWVKQKTYFKDDYCPYCDK